MKTSLTMRPAGTRRQRGAVAIMFGLLLAALLLAGGMVIDLGRLYVLKSELQNAADSAALAGANELNMTSGGITDATDKALAFAAENKFNFSSALVLARSDVMFSDNPDSGFVSEGAAMAAPMGKTFIRVTTPTPQLRTFLMNVPPASIANIGTSAVAVAGRFVVDITPLGICAVDAVNRLHVQDPLVNMELREYGFRRGTTYDMLQMKNIAGTSDPMLINPVDSPPAACGPSNSSANFTAPFLCQGNSVVGNNGTAVYANTGVSAGPVEKALNSRFNDFGGGSQCIPASAPPDRNVREYIHDSTVDWMSPAQSAQSQPIIAGIPAPATSTATNGVLWSYSRPLQATGTPGNYSAGAPFATTDWASLYPPFAPSATGAYPPGATASPYAATSGAHFLAPTGNAGVAKRRQLNLAILDCTIPAGSGSCQQVPLLGIGRFFLQRRVSLTTNPKGMWVEFAGLIEPVPNSEIKLYR